MPGGSTGHVAVPSYTGLSPPLSAGDTSPLTARADSRYFLPHTPPLSPLAAPMRLPAGWLDYRSPRFMPSCVMRDFLKLRYRLHAHWSTFLADMISMATEFRACLPRHELPSSPVFNGQPASSAADTRLLIAHCFSAENRRHIARRTTARKYHSAQASYLLLWRWRFAFVNYVILRRHIMNFYSRHAMHTAL